MKPVACRSLLPAVACCLPAVTSSYRSFVASLPQHSPSKLPVFHLRPSSLHSYLRRNREHGGTSAVPMTDRILRSVWYVASFLPGKGRGALRLTRNPANCALFTQFSSRLFVVKQFG